MVKGGYQILNFNDTDFRSGVPMEIEDIYDKIEGTRKSILISGLIIDGVELHDFYATPKVVGSSYVFNIIGYRIEISDIDIVTIIKDDDILVIGTDILATGTYFDIDEDTYNKIDNMSYDNVPNWIDITYNGVRYMSHILSFDGVAITFVANKVIVGTSIRIDDGKYKISIN